jgi:signal transduction histidine kinase
MKEGESGTPGTPGRGHKAPIGPLDVRGLRDLVASAAGAVPAITVDRPYAEALRNSVDWLWQTDAEFNLTYVSRGLEEIRDAPRESWLGRSLLSLADREADDATPSPLLVALKARRAFRDCTVEWTSEAEQRVRFRLTGLPFEDDATGAFAGFRGTASASSEPAEDTRTARELLDLLKAALSERDQLQQQLAEIEDETVKERLAGIAHELRTPLNAIIGFSELIRDQAFGDDPRRYSEYGGNIHRSGMKLLQLVNRILDIAEDESELRSIEALPFDVESVVRATIEIMADSAAAARVALYLDVATDLPRVVGDAQMTRQILFHLLSRVLQQAPEGWTAGIRVTADNERDDAGRAGVRVTVWDAPAEDDKSRRSGPPPGGSSDVERAAGDTGAEAAESVEDLGPVVLQHLAETMGARLEMAGLAGRGGEARLRLTQAPVAPSD